MPSFKLIAFSTQNAPNITIEAQINPREDAVFISFKLTGDLGTLELGACPRHERTMKLWEKTCFELFIKNASGQYMEFNFSPEFEWNAFYFAKKGDALCEWQKMQKVKIDILHSLEVFELIAEIKRADFPDGFFKGPQAGISSVIKEKNGRLSYWAISHEDQRPNFHHFDSFKYKF